MRAKKIYGSVAPSLELKVQQGNRDVGFKPLPGTSDQAPLWIKGALVEHVDGATGQGGLELVLAGGMLGAASERAGLLGGRLRLEAGRGATQPRLQLELEGGLSLSSAAGSYGVTRLALNGTGRSVSLELIEYPNELPFLNLEGERAVLWRGGTGAGLVLELEGRALRHVLGRALPRELERLWLRGRWLSGLGDSGWVLESGELRLGWEAACGCFGLELFWKHEVSAGSGWGVRGAPANP